MLVNATAPAPPRHDSARWLVQLATAGGVAAACVGQPVGPRRVPDALVRVQVLEPDVPRPYADARFVRVRLRDRAGERWVDGRTFQPWGPAIQVSEDVRTAATDSVRADVFLVPAPGDTVGRARVVLPVARDRRWRLDVYLGGVRPFSQLGPYTPWPARTVAGPITTAEARQAGDSVYVVFTAHSVSRVGIP